MARLVRNRLMQRRGVINVTDGSSVTGFKSGVGGCVLPSVRRRISLDPSISDMPLPSRLGGWAFFAAFRFADGLPRSVM